MSHKTDIYGNYLRKWEADHAGMVKPEVLGFTSPYEKVQAALALASTGERISCAAKAIGWNICEGVYELPDGRVIEVGRSESGLGIAAIFPDRKAWSAYSEPMSSRGYFEEW